MPTGYTSRILDGKVTTLSQFAKECMRGFGATMHMRDDLWDAPYKPAEVSSYHQDALNEANKRLEKLETASDEKLLKDDKKSVKEDIQRYIVHIQKAKDDKKKLEAVLAEVNAWQPPTDSHVEFKKFMIDQIEKTIDWDCKPDYWETGLKELEEYLQNVTIEQVRAKEKKSIDYDLNYHTKELNSEKERVEKNNKWVQDLLKALP